MDEDGWEIAPPSVLPDDPATNASGDWDFTKKDGIGMFNNLLGAWLQHDAMSMGYRQPQAYGRQYAQQQMPNGQNYVQQQNQKMLLLVMIGVGIYMLAKA